MGSDIPSRADVVEFLAGKLNVPSEVLTDDTDIGRRIVKEQANGFRIADEVAMRFIRVLEIPDGEPFTVGMLVEQVRAEY